MQNEFRLTVRKLTKELSSPPSKCACPSHCLARTSPCGSRLSMDRQLSAVRICLTSSRLYFDYAKCQPQGNEHIKKFAQRKRPLAALEVDNETNSGNAQPREVGLRQPGSETAFSHCPGQT